MGAGEPGTAERSAVVSPTDAACSFVQIVTNFGPHVSNNLDREIVKAARKIARRLHAAGIMHPDFEMSLPPVSASGVPLTRSIL